MKRYSIGEFEGLVEDEHGYWMRHEDHLSELADANHMLLLANNSRDACMRMANEARNQVQRYRHVLEIMVAAGKCSYADIEGAEKIFDGLSQELQPSSGLPAGRGG
jgi:hypothetical protein